MSNIDVDATKEQGRNLELRRALNSALVISAAVVVIFPSALE